MNARLAPSPRTVAIVTGASRGLGQAFAHELASQCTHVLTLARRAHADEQTTQIAAQHGCQLQHIACDLSDATQWPAVAEQVQAWFQQFATPQRGQAQTANAAMFEPRKVATANEQQPSQAGLNSQVPERYLLINNAGTLGPMAQYVGLAQLGSESATIAQAMNLNISAVIYLSSVFVHTAKSSHEAHSSVTPQIQVINISSGAARKPYPGWAVYCASKAALDRYSEVLQVEAPFAQIASIAPGVLDTAMQADIRQSTAEDFPNIQRFIDLHAEQALSSPLAVAKQILAYSLSPEFGQQTLQDIRLITP